MLRAEAQRLRERVALLESETDHHPLLPILSQRAFMRQLAHVIEHVGQLPSPACLLILSVANGDAIRQRFGLAIRDQAIKHLVEVAKGVLLPTDVLGGLGGNDLGIILIVAGEPVARERARHLREAIAARPFAWQSQPVPLEIACGIVLLDAGVTPASALVMADGDLRASRTQVPAPP
jgi:GGDEF domain-containing protein